MDTITAKSHIPPGFPAVTPFITVEDPGQLVEFAKAAFGAEELREQQGRTEDGKVMHAAFRIEGCIIEAGRASAQWKAMPTALHLYVRDADSAYARALKAGEAFTRCAKWTMVNAPRLSETHLATIGILPPTRAGARRRARL